MKRKALLIGGGGQGSWIATFLRYYADRGQLDEMDLTIADPDKVDRKNLFYSNFLLEDIGKNKAEVLGKRYKFKYDTIQIINSSQLKDYDLIILAVDNSKARDIVYRSNKFWIDCRSKGMGYSIFFKSEKTRNNILNLSRPAESCQYENRLEEGLIDCGNVVSAIIGTGQILNYFRGKMSISEIVGIL